MNNLKDVVLIIIMIVSAIEWCVALYFDWNNKPAKASPHFLKAIGLFIILLLNK